MQLSLLDFGYVPPATSAAEELRQLVESAPVTESLGYSRFWLAEHHEAHFSYSVPEILIPVIAARTSRIRVGAAGVLLHFHSPLKIAESFRMLEALYPGRIDLGVASGVTGSAMIQRALRHGFDMNDAVQTRLYTSQVEELIGWCRNTIVPTVKLYGGPTPVGHPSPPIMLLGGGKGQGNMIMAAKHGTAFCYSLSHGMSDTGAETVRRYREQFTPSTQADQPHAMIAASVICGETNNEAIAMQNYFFALDKNLKATVIGRPERCRDRIRELLDEYGCDEFVVMPMANNYGAKLDAYRMLAEACGIKRPEPANPDPPAAAEPVPAMPGSI